MTKPPFWEQNIFNARPCISCSNDGIPALKFENEKGFTMCNHCDVPQPEALVPAKV